MFERSSESGVNGGVAETSANSRPRESQFHYKLPALNLPKFSGKYETWLGFSDTFKALVDSNKNIQDVEKLVHLKSCSENEAAEVIASMPTSSENYQVAWQLLQVRYGNKKVILESHVQAILNL